MVDGVLILVDAAEGPMPQTRFVTRKALALGLQPIVAINKIDRPDAEPLRVHDEVLGLFIDLEATHEQLDAPFLYTSSRAGTATTELDQPGTDLDAALRDDPRPRAGADRAIPTGPFQMLISTLDFSTFLGRIGDRAHRAGPGRRSATRWRCCRWASRGWWPTRRSSGAGSPSSTPSTASTGSRCRTADAGDIVALAGFEDDRDRQDAHRRRASRSGCEGIAVEEPTISVDFIVNNSPVRRAGREVRHQSRQVRDRLFKELERNVALRVEDDRLARTPAPSRGAVSCTSAS